MKKAELEKIIQEINQKIENVDTLNNKIKQADEALNNIKGSVEELKQSTKEISTFKDQICNIKTEIESSKSTIEGVADSANSYNETIKKQAEEYNTFKNNFESLLAENNELSQTIKSQLGLVSMEILANSFANESDKLKSSVDKWFKWVLYSTIFLFLSVLAVAVWQIKEEGNLFEFTFFYRIPIILPILYFVVFVLQQYGRDKKLFDEYVFKASVARSFEAYRKLLNEEGAETSDKQKTHDFIISTIREVYSSPMENMCKYKEVEKDEIGVDLLSKITNILKKLIEK